MIRILFYNKKSVPCQMECRDEEEKNEVIGKICRDYEHVYVIDAKGKKKRIK